MRPKRTSPEDHIFNTGIVIRLCAAYVLSLLHGDVFCCLRPRKEMCPAICQQLRLNIHIFSVIEIRLVR